MFPGKSLFAKSSLRGTCHSMPSLKLAAAIITMTCAIALLVNAVLQNKDSSAAKLLNSLDFIFGESNASAVTGSNRANNNDQKARRPCAENIQYHLIVEGEVFRLTGETMTGVAIVWVNLLKYLSSSKRALYSCPTTPGPQHKVIFIDIAPNNIGSRTIAAMRHTCDDGTTRQSVIMVPKRDSLESTIINDVPKAISAAGYSDTGYPILTVYTSSYYTFPNLQQLPAPKMCTILYVHDTIPEHGNFLTPGSEWWPRKLATEFVNSFVSVSRNTLRDYVHWYAPFVLRNNVNKDAALKLNDLELENSTHMTVISNRLSRQEFPGPANDSAIAAFREKYKLPSTSSANTSVVPERDYLLVLRHKSCDLVLKAFDNLPDEFIRKYSLVFGTWQYRPGGNGLKHKLVLDAAAKTDEPVIRLYNLGYLPRELVHVAMSGAFAVVYITPYEGFGLPIAEAFASGTLVVTGNWSVMPEVGGDAAFYINKNEHGLLAETLAKMMRLKNAERQQRIVEGLKRAALFGGGYGKSGAPDAWEDAAAEFVQHIKSTKHKGYECDCPANATKSSTL